MFNMDFVHYNISILQMCLLKYSFVCEFKTGFKLQNMLDVSILQLSLFQIPLKYY